MAEPLHHKTIQHFHEPGDCHELTFSCVNQRPLLIRDEWRALLCRSIDSALVVRDLRLLAFVLMPEHVHLLLYPATSRHADISRFLKAVKRPFSYHIRQQLERERNTLLDELSYVDKRGERQFQFWQAGPGYDRNLSTPAVVLASMDYIHANPVKRGLCSRAQDWKWSSARAYCSETYVVDEDLPSIHRLPSHFLS
jgi:putative transposase